MHHLFLLTDGPHGKQRIRQGNNMAHRRHQDWTRDKFAEKTTAVALMNRCHCPEKMPLKKEILLIFLWWIYTAVFNPLKNRFL